MIINNLGCFGLTLLAMTNKTGDCFTASLAFAVRNDGHKEEKNCSCFADF
jgi:hypothetical protein